MIGTVYHSYPDGASFEEQQILDKHIFLQNPIHIRKSNQMTGYAGDPIEKTAARKQVAVRKLKYRRNESVKERRKFNGLEIILDFFLC